MSKAKYHVPQPGELVEFQNVRGVHGKVIVSKWDSKHGLITSIGGLTYRVRDRSTIKMVGPATSAPKEAEPTATVTRRPTVGDWVEVIEVDECDIVKVGDVVKIIGDDHDSALYEVKENGDYCLRESQVKLTDKRPTDAPDPASGAPEPRPRTEEHLFREPVAVSTEFTARLPTSFASEVARAETIADAEAENKTRHEAAEAKCDELADKIAALINERRDVMADDEDAQHDFENRLEYLRSLRVRGVE